MSDRFDHTLEHTLDIKAAEPDDAGLVRRIELITGTGRRRQWSGDDKARIVIESLRPGANVSEVARQHGLSPQQLFGWRREARALMAADAGDEDAGKPEQATPTAARGKRRRLKSSDVERSCVDGTPAFASVVIATPRPSSPPPPPAPSSSSLQSSRPRQRR